MLLEPWELPCKKCRSCWREPMEKPHYTERERRWLNPAFQLFLLRDQVSCQLNPTNRSLFEVTEFWGSFPHRNRSSEPCARTRAATLVGCESKPAFMPEAKLERTSQFTSFLSMLLPAAEAGLRRAVQSRRPAKPNVFTIWPFTEHGL